MLQCVTRHALAALALSFFATGCCLFPGPEQNSAQEAEPAVEAPAPAAEVEPSSIQVTGVVFARALDDDWQPVGGAAESFPADITTVWARVTLDGRPSSGVVTMRWMWRDLKLAEAPVDLSDVSGGVIFSFGQDTVLRGFVTVPVLYIGGGNRLVLSVGERELGSYSFSVVPPEGAIPSRFVSAELYRSFSTTVGPSDPGNTFGPNDNIYIVGQAQQGDCSWLDVKVGLNGEDKPELTLERLARENIEEAPFVFNRAPPEGGWPTGDHVITLVLDDEDVATYPFTISP